MAINQFSKDLQRLHVEKNSYRTEGDPKNLQFIPDDNVTDEGKIKAAKDLLAFSKDATQRYGFNSEEVAIISTCAYQAIKDLKKLPKVDSEEIKKLTEEAAWNLMGHTEVPKADENLTELFDKLVIGNKIHYAVNRLHQMNQSAPLSLLINGKWVNLADLTQEKEEETIVFKDKQGKTLFKTDSTYQFNLEEYYYCGKHGIVQGNFYKDTRPIVEGFDKVENHDGKYYVLIMTGITSEESYKNVLGAGTPHSFYGLIDAEGNRTYCGEYAVFGNVNQMGSIHCDRMMQMPHTHHYTNAVKKEISKEQYDLMKAQMIIDIEKGRQDPIDAEDNCTNYVSTRLKQAGVELEGGGEWKTTLLNIGFRWLITYICPKSWYKPITDFIEDLPLVIRAPLHFFPPVYIANVVLGLIQTISGFFFQEGHHPLYNFKFLLKAIFCPWVPNIHHPLALARWQKAQETKN